MIKFATGWLKLAVLLPLSFIGMAQLGGNWETTPPQR